MRLADFIRHNHHNIIAEWETFARSLLPPGRKISALTLRDHAEQILDAIAEDMSSFQSSRAQTEKSRGHGADVLVGGAGKTHAALRIETGFKLDHLVAEYRALRASVLRLWAAAGDGSDLEGVTRFNEAVDEALAQSTRRYMAMMERHRDEFLGILGHDLRNPLNAIVMGASLLVASPGKSDDTARVAGGIVVSARRMNRMIGDLLDLTRTRLGGGMPIVVAPIDLRDVCKQVVAELQAAQPAARIEASSEGDLRGEWDADRLAQVVSNLLGNAMQHGKKHGPISLSLRDEGHEVVVAVHNEGPPIPASVLPTIFEPMRCADEDRHEKRSTSLGLGLYIAQQIVGAHGGHIAVTSTKSGGTTFSVHLPRHSSRKA